MPQPTAATKVHMKPPIFTLQTSCSSKGHLQQWLWSSCLSLAATRYSLSQAHLRSSCRCNANIQSSRPTDSMTAALACTTAASEPRPPIPMPAAMRKTGVHTSSACLTYFQGPHS